jgi:hypothetical protein
MSDKPDNPFHTVRTLQCSHPIGPANEPLPFEEDEVFAQAFVRTRGIHSEAYVAAYPKDLVLPWPRQNRRGIGMARTPHIAARIAYLRGTLHSAQDRAMVVRSRPGGHAIRDREDRVAALNERWEALLQVVEERGADPSMQDVPGGPSGLVVRKMRTVGKGQDTKIIEEYEVDVATLKELRECEKQAAIEQGQWAERQEVTGKDGVPLPAATIHVNINPVAAKPQEPVE